MERLEAIRPQRRYAYLDGRRMRTAAEQARLDELYAATGSNQRETHKLRSRYRTGLETHHNGKWDLAEARAHQTAMEATAQPLEPATATALQQVTSDLDAIGRVLDEQGGWLSATVEIPARNGGALVIEALQEEEEVGVSYRVDRRPADADEQWSAGYATDPYRHRGRAAQARPAGPGPGRRRRPNQGERMIVEASGPEQIRAAFSQAVAATGERAEEVGGVAGILGDAAHRYEALQMQPSTAERQREAGTAFATAHPALVDAREQLHAALADFNNHDDQVADAVARRGFFVPGGATWRSPPGGGARCRWWRAASPGCLRRRARGSRQGQTVRPLA
ncbi:hypothetical protein PVK74_30480 [Micromonospora chalcea]|uniref:hypothetical protein n=1 Tax=Micromonospora chalcea TaxID=1874 RepID=UPI00237801B1|nr:hypothetical protein [Micromonospora chalcea]WDQ00099.1 hypothetical protein PVK74_30480 [Micromonospora chalcea]